jgi:hypothetical protein
MMNQRKGRGSKRSLTNTNLKSELPYLRSRKRLTPRFGEIENVRNFDVEKMVLFEIVFYRKP